MVVVVLFSFVWLGVALSPIFVSFFSFFLIKSTTWFMKKKKKKQVEDSDDSTKEWSLEEEAILDSFFVQQLTSHEPLVIHDLSEIYKLLTTTPMVNKISHHIEQASDLKT